MVNKTVGKTRTGAEQVRKWEQSGVKRIALIGETPGDVRDVMINGPGGLTNIYPPGEEPEYFSSRREVEFKSGTIAKIYSAANPSALRGPEHEKAWADEVASWKYPDKTWDNLMMGLRLGDHPQVVATTTPRPIDKLKALEKRGVKESSDVHLTRGSSYENIDNLPEIFTNEILAEYEGTRLGKQELHAKVLDDTKGALWKHSDITHVEKNPSFVRIVIGVDPQAKNKDNSDDTGIIVVGLGVDGFAYVLADYTVKDTPYGWAKAVVSAYNKYDADRVIGESNQGGDMVESTIRTIKDDISYKSVHASRGKFTRAEPVASLYEQTPKKVYHLGNHSELEDEMTTWVADGTMDSPNRVDALVWALTDLMLGDRVSSNIYA